MKLRTTTPASHSFILRIAVILVIVVISVTLPIQFFANRPVAADDYDVQIAAIEREVASYQVEAEALRSQADTLRNTISQLQNDRAKIQAQIALSEAQHDKLVQEIRVNEEQIAENRKVSGELIVNSTLSGDIPLIVRLAASENLADYIEGEANINSVRDTIVQKTNEVEKLRAELVVKREEVQKVLNRQQLHRQEFISKETAQAQLLSETRGSEATYRSMISDSSSQIQELKRQQEAQRLAAQSWGGGFISVGGNGGGYPYHCGSYPCWRLGYVDPWGLYYQECVSYVAWKLDSEGYGVQHFRGAGNATQWPSTASYASWQTGGTPKKGDAMVRFAASAGDPGHVSYVESVSGNGTIVVSEYNFRVDGAYTKRSLTPGEYGGMIFGTFPRK